MHIDSGSGRCPKSFGCSARYVRFCVDTETSMQVQNRSVAITKSVRRQVSSKEFQLEMPLSRDICVVPSKKMLRVSLQTSEEKMICYVDTAFVHRIEFRVENVDTATLCIDLLQFQLSTSPRNLRGGNSAVKLQYMMH